MRTTPPPNIQLKTVAQRRARIRPDLKAKLEEEYIKNPRPNKSEKHKIALKTDMSDDNVHFWFQNRRARASREAKLAAFRSSSTSASADWPIRGPTASSASFLPFGGTQTIDAISSSSLLGHFNGPDDLHRTFTTPMTHKSQTLAVRLPPIISLLDREESSTTGAKHPH